MTGLARQAVAEADRALADHPLFGDSARSLDKVLARYRFGLELFAEHLPSLRSCAASFATLEEATTRRVCFDPLVRLAFEAAFSGLEAGRLAPPHRIEQVLPQALQVLPLGLCQSHMARRWSVRGDPPKWLWDLGDADDPHRRTLQAAFERIFAGDARSAGVLLSPDASACSRIDEASDLLGTLLPHSGRSALRHVEAIALLRARLEGGTVLSAAGGDLTPSTIFLSLDELGNSWDIAGCLLHEGLHLKLFDAARSVALAREPNQTVQVPWRNVRWSIVRALFAHHVYVHLSLFKAAALIPDRSCQERFGDPRAFVTRPHAMSVSQDQRGTAFGRSIDRARYLGENLEGRWSPLLSEQGAGAGGVAEPRPGPGRPGGLRRGPGPRRAGPGAAAQGPLSAHAPGAARGMPDGLRPRGPAAAVPGSERLVNPGARRRPHPRGAGAAVPRGGG